MGEEKPTAPDLPVQADTPLEETLVHAPALTRQDLREELRLFARDGLAEALARELPLLTARAQQDPSTQDLGNARACVAKPAAPDRKQDAMARSLPSVLTAGRSMSEPPVMKVVRASVCDAGEPEFTLSRRHYRNHTAAAEKRAIEREVESNAAAHLAGSAAAAAAATHWFTSRGKVGSLQSFSEVMPEDFSPKSGDGILKEGSFGPLCNPAEVSRPPPKIAVVLAGLHEWLLTAVTKPSFDYCVGILIFANAACIGAQADYNARNLNEQDLPFFEVVEWLFCVLFSCELFARLVAYHKQFFVMPGRLWNIFDFVLVLMQIIEKAAALHAATSGGDGQTEGGGFSAMRILRILRVIRIVRLVRVLRLIAELRTIVICIAGSLRSLLWTVVLLLVMIYIVAVYLTQLVSNYRMERGDSPASEGLCYYFGSLGRSMLSLYQAMSGGISWDVATEPLMQHISPLLGVLFTMYIAFALLAVMNVVTGVFVETALETAQKDKEVFLIHHAREIFSASDKDLDGNLDWVEFEGQLHSREMRDLFHLIGIDASEARSLFQLLDCEGTGTISFDDFLNGCLRLRGQAKSIDLMTVMYENQRYSKSSIRQIKKVQDNLCALAEQLASAPSHT